MIAYTMPTTKSKKRFGASQTCSRLLSHSKCSKFALIIGLTLIFLANIFDVGMMNSAHAQNPTNPNLSLIWDSGQDTPIISDDENSHTDRTGKLRYSDSGLYEAVATTYRNERFIRTSRREQIASRRNVDNRNFDVGKGLFEHGHWEFRNPTAAKCVDDSSRFCADVKFVVDKDAVKKLEGATIRNTIVLQYVVPMPNRAGSIFYEDSGVSIRLNAIIQGQSQVEITWDQGSTGEINWENNGTYPDLTGRIHRYDKAETIQTTIATVEIEGIPSTTRPTTTTNGDPSTTSCMINNLEAMIYGSNLPHGTWCVATDYSSFVFRPNADAINRFQQGDLFTSRLMVSITPTGNTNASATHMIEVEIGRRISLTLTLDTGSEEIISDGTSTTYAIREGTIAISGGVSSNYDIEGEASQKLSTATTSTTATGLMSSNDADYDVVGSHGALSYGDWYVAKDHSEFQFRPHAMNINGVEFGKTYITTLTLRYITHDGNNQNIKTRAETTITLEITRQLQFDIEFTTNDINRDELVINSGETILAEYAASGEIMNPPDGSSNRIESILERKNNGNPIELTIK